VPTASEDDEGQTLRALRRIAAASLPCPVQMGVNRGHVFAAELGTSWRAAYSAMGDTTNTAARIAAQAPTGAVYAHPSVLDHARTLREASPVGPFTFKGKSEPISLYAVGAELGRRSRSDRDTLPMVGRTREVARLQDALDRLREGHGGVITVLGPAGMGKSRLVQEAFASAGTARLDVRAEPYGVTTPYRPLRDPVRRLLGVERGESAAMTAALLGTLERVTPAVVPFAPLLGAVAHVEVQATPETEAVADRHRPDRTADVLIELLRAVRQGPLAIVVEDAQWVDESTAHIVGRLASATEVQPWLLIVTRRDSDSGFTPSEGERLVIGPLDDDTVREFAKLATEATPLRPHELESIVAQAAGSPLFIEEMSRTVRTVGSLNAIPESINAAIAAQVDALAPPARRVLGYASVLGRSFRRQVLFELMHADGFELDESTRVELGRFFDRDGDESRLRFHNGLVRDVVYEGMAYRTRARLHGMAAETLERISDDCDVDADMLAHHFWQAGDASSTWHYSRRAARRATQAHANAEGATQLERALDACRRLPEITADEQFHCWLQLGELRDRAGLFAEALEAYGNAARLSRDDPVQRAGLFLRRARTHERAGSFSIALRTATMARGLLDRADGAAPTGARADALAFAALVRQRQERVHEALRLAEDAMEEGRRSAALPAQARASNVISWAATMLGRPDASDWAHRSLSLYEAVGDLDGQADLANNLGVQAYFDGRWSETLELYRRARDAYQRVGSAIDAATTDANIGEVLVNQGRLDEAEPLLREASRVHRASGHRLGVAFAEMHHGRLLVRRGDMHMAVGVLTGAREQFASMGRAASVYETSLHLADCLTRIGRPSDALELLAEDAGASRDDVSILDASRARFKAEALIALGRLDEASAELAAGLSVARARRLEYELSLLLALTQELPFVVPTGSDEPPIVESDRLLTRLDVIDRPLVGVA
jgi:tetratricopeptide (TPR) repeat protein